MLSHRMDGMGWDGTRNFENSPIPWDEKFLKQIPSHDGTEIFEICPIPWDNSGDFIPWDDFFSSHPIPRGALIHTVFILSFER